MTERHENLKELNETFTIRQIELLKTVIETADVQRDWNATAEGSVCVDDVQGTLQDLSNEFKAMLCGTKVPESCCSKFNDMVDSLEIQFLSGEDEVLQRGWWLYNPDDGSEYFRFNFCPFCGAGICFENTTT